MPVSIIIFCVLSTTFDIHTTCVHLYVNYLIPEEVIDISQDGYDLPTPYPTHTLKPQMQRLISIFFSFFY